MLTDQQSFETGRQHYDAGRYEEAIHFFLEAIRTTPEPELDIYCDLHRYLAKSYLYSGKITQAIEHFTSLVTIAPSDNTLSDCYDGLAICYLQQRNLREAGECCALALQYNTNNLSAKHNQALVYLEYLQYDEGLSSTDRAKYGATCKKLLIEILSCDQTHYQALNSMASLYELHEEYDKALRYYTRAKLHCPETDAATKKAISDNLSECHAQIGHVCYQIKEYKSAGICYKNALRENEGHDVARSQLGMSFYRLQNYVAAQICFDKIITTATTDQDKADALMNKAACLRELKKYSRAQEALNRAEQLVTGDVTLLDEQQALRYAAATRIQSQVRVFLGKIHQEAGSLHTEKAVSEFGI